MGYSVCKHHRVFHGKKTLQKCTVLLGSKLLVYSIILSLRVAYTFKQLVSLCLGQLVLSTYAACVRRHCLPIQTRYCDLKEFKGSEASKMTPVYRLCKGKALPPLLCLRVW